MNFFEFFWKESQTYLQISLRIRLSVSKINKRLSVRWGFKTMCNSLKLSVGVWHWSAGGFTVAG